MLDPYFMKGIEKFSENDNYIVWKFPASKDAYEKQKRPLIYSYSIMSRAYGTWFNDDNFIRFFNDEGFDVYLVDWGTSSLFSLSGWTLDDLLETLEYRIIDPLLDIYQVEKVNVFAVCMGGTFISYLIAQRGEEVCRKLHRIAYYGVPIMGGRDLGVEKTFKTFYKLTEPYQWLLKDCGISLFFLDMLLLYSTSTSMLHWKWYKFFQENQNGSFFNILRWTYDDRWVPFSVLTQIIRNVFVSKGRYKRNHPPDVTADIHFLNIIGKDDMLVNPSASIIEWNSPVPSLYKSFKQMIVSTGHFLFARPGYKREKKEIALWFSGYNFSSLLYKMKTDKAEIFVERTYEIVKNSVCNAYRKAPSLEKEMLIRQLNGILNTQMMLDDIEELSAKLIKTLAVCEDETFYAAVEHHISPLVEKYSYRRG